VTLQELYTYLEQQVTQKSRACRWQPAPGHEGGDGGPTALVKVGGR
jgi:hypothetical protein